MSNTVVVDTSIVIKWVIDETDSSIAVALLARWISEGLIILAPSLLAYEITNVLYQRLRKGSITLDEADDQGFSHFERRRVRNERGHSQQASLKRSLSFFMHPPQHLAETLIKQHEAPVQEPSQNIQTSANIPR